MKIAIMQPYIFPYIGYFQLINAVDIFVIYDDVSFIKQGWINRNRILVNGHEHMFNIRLVGGGSSNKKINEFEILTNNDKLLKTIEQAYKKASNFLEVYPIITNILSVKETNLARYLLNSLNIIIDYLDINVTVLVSSEIKKDLSLKGTRMVVEICKQIKATNYINAWRGQELYSKEMFKENDLSLNFIKSKPITYPQFNNEFIPWLSIIDVMMFNKKEKINEMLNQYELI